MLIDSDLPSAVSRDSNPFLSPSRKRGDLSLFRENRETLRGKRRFEFSTSLRNGGDLEPRGRRCVPTPATQLPAVVDSAGKIDRRYRSMGRAAQPAVGWPISCQSNWLAGRVPGRGGGGGGEPCARLALPAFHRRCMHASKRGSVHACPCNACNPFDRVRREGVDRSGKASLSASARPCANPWVKESGCARERISSREADRDRERERERERERGTAGETEITSGYIRARTRVHTYAHDRLLPW